MKNFFTILAIGMSSIASAQMTLEHSYPENASMSAVLIEGEGVKYVAFDSTHTRLRFYNLDHSIWKGFFLPTISGHTPAYFNYPSKYLFNSDNTVEVLVTYAQYAPTVHYQTELLTESGTSIQSLNNVQGIAVVKTAVGSKALANFYKTSPTAGYWTDVYSLPGQWTGQLKVPVTAGEGSSELYPNPLQSSGVLEYRLPAGDNSGQLEILDAAGKTVRTYPIMNNSGSLIVDRGALAPGTYLYQTTSTNSKSGTKAITIN